MADCIFCKIVERHIPATIVAENEHAIAFRDIQPQAPAHLLVVPKRHIQGIADVTPEDGPVLASLMLLATEVARAEKLHTSGYRLVVNQGADGGQSVHHIHLHVLGGRPMRWPPG
jgi:histidine triad (HIT) family protein